MLALAIKLMNKYKPLLVKLHKDATVWRSKEIATKCYSGLTDVQIMVGVACIMPMLRATNSLPVTREIYVAIIVGVKTQVTG